MRKCFTAQASSSMVAEQTDKKHLNWARKRSSRARAKQNQEQRKQMLSDAFWRAGRWRFFFAIAEPESIVSWLHLPEI